MKVLWVADFSISHNPGGAQRTNQYVIDKGRELGHDITEYNYDSPQELLDADYDLAVSNNLEHLYHQKNPVLEYLVRHPPHVRFEHDGCFYLSPDERHTIFSSTILNVFLSGYHHQQFVSLYGNIFGDPAYIPPYIPTDIFYDHGKEREDATVTVGLLHALKGVHNFKNEVLAHPNQKYVVAGWCENHKLQRSLEQLPNLEWKGKVGYRMMPMIFNRYTRFFYHPIDTFFEPWCRSVGEAAFCGINLDCSDNIGAIRDIQKYSLDKLQQLCSNAPNEFWNVIARTH